MRFTKRIASGWAIIAALLYGGGFHVQPAQAAFILTLQQEGSNVVATGTGTFDLADLDAPVVYAGASAGMSPMNGRIIVGPVTQVDLAAYPGITGPTSFGTGVSQNADSGSGSLLGVTASASSLLLPQGYVSGNTLSSTATWDGQTFSSLGVTLGTYRWDWGSGANADFFRWQSSRAQQRCRNLPRYCFWHCRLAS